MTGWKPAPRFEMASIFLDITMEPISPSAFRILQFIQINHVFIGSEWKATKNFVNVLTPLRFQCAGNK
jgi:hypothetical protein